MKGYKALDQDMGAVYGNGMQYEIGKWYCVDGEVIPCKNGFHFCDRIEDLVCYYNLADSRIFEVEADGTVVVCSDKNVSEKIMLIRELSKEEIKEYFKQNQESLICSENWCVRKVTAEQNCGLEKLIHDTDWQVRVAVARQGYGLDTLINDGYWQVRVAVAEQCYGLGKLIYDEDYDVRAAVARQGYGLDELIHDKSWRVRQAIAEHGYGLEMLVDDDKWQVRYAVAEHGYGLDILVNDEDDCVRTMAYKMLDDLSKKQ